MSNKAQHSSLILNPNQVQLRSALARRDFLKQLGGACAVGAVGAHALKNTAWAFGSERFKLGVASGDPHASGFSLWTRIAPEPLLAFGGLNQPRITVRYEVALDPEMRQIVRSGNTVASRLLGYNVKVDFFGLAPGRWYWYRFICEGEDSPIGRTRTFPSMRSAANRMRYALVSCQDYQNGFFSAYRNLAQEDLDAVFHVGDYIYEYGPNPDAVRPHNAPETETLEDYRIRYALYRLDPDLQAAHAAFPFICTWDDHEAENNYAGLIPENGQDPVAFRARRAAAYRAYYEAMPINRMVRPRRERLRLHRQINFGNLASFFVLDTRQFRSDQPCDPTDSAIAPACPERMNANQTMLGRRQLSWLERGLRRTRAQWNVLSQQVMFTPWNLQAINPAASEIYNMDAWDGYPLARRRITQMFTDHAPKNPLILTGDIHSSWAAEIKRDAANPESQSIAAEFVGTSITSDFPAQFIPLVQATLPDNPQIRYFDGSYRGYVRFDLTRKSCRVDYRAVDSILDPNAAVSTVASFEVQDGSSTIHSA